ncbi:thioesterase family protein [soil metagenome]
MPSLGETLSTLVAEGDDFCIEAPEDWAQGRTLFGGMTAALSYTALTRALGDLGPLRSAQFTFVGPASGRLNFRSTLLRRGRSSAIVGVDCSNGEGPAARSTFVFGGARESEIVHDFTPVMHVPTPDECEPFHKTGKPPTGFHANFEFRLAAGSRLFTQASKPEFAVWVRLREPDAVDPVAALLALADALPCAAMTAFSKPAAISTITWSTDFHAPLNIGSGWHLIWSSSESAADGYSLQDMRIYDAQLKPMLSSRQVVAVFI